MSKQAYRNIKIQIINKKILMHKNTFLGSRKKQETKTQMIIAMNNSKQQDLKQ